MKTGGSPAPYDTSHSSQAKTSTDRTTIEIPRLDFAICLFFSLSVSIKSVSFHWMTFCLRVTIPGERTEYYRFKELGESASASTLPFSFSYNNSDIESATYVSLPLKGRHKVTDFFNSPIWIDGGPSAGAGTANLSTAKYFLGVSGSEPETVGFQIEGSSTVAFDFSARSLSLGNLREGQLLFSRKLPVLPNGGQRSVSGQDTSVSTYLAGKESFEIVYDPEDDNFMQEHDKKSLLLWTDKNAKKFIAVAHIVIGDVTVIRNFELRTRAALREGDYLYENDSIYTNTNSRMVAIVVHNHLKISVGPNGYYVVSSVLLNFHKALPPPSTLSR